MTTVPPIAEYTVRRYALGAAIFGPVPISDLVALLAAWKSEGLDQIHSGIGVALGAQIVVASKENGAAWARELAAAKGAMTP